VPNPLKHRKAIGHAVWLLEVLMNYAPANCSGEKPFWAGDGALFSDAILEKWIGVKAKTLSKWRRKLKAAGLLDWTIKPGEGRMYLVGPIKEPGATTLPPIEEAAPVQPKWVQ
jgi:hypothetical protein